MNNVLKFTLSVCILMTSSSVFAQEHNLEKASSPVDGYHGIIKNDKKKPMPLAELKAEDISFSKRVWQEIDGRLSINRGLISPTSSLISILMKNIKDGTITAYDPTPNLDKDDPNGDSFKTTLSPTEALFNLTGKDSLLVEVFDENGEVTSQNWVQAEFNPESVYLFRIKEDWIFDEKRSVFEPRIIGIAPLIIPNSLQDEASFNNSFDDPIQEELLTQIETKPAFWLYFPDIREVLVNSTIANDHNDAQRISFDDFFIGRHFDSYIIKVSNSQNLRIKDYKKTKIEQLQESERIKNQLMQYQSDLYRK